MGVKLVDSDKQKPDIIVWKNDFFCQTVMKKASRSKKCPQNRIEKVKTAMISSKPAEHLLILWYAIQGETQNKHFFYTFRATILNTLTALNTLLTFHVFKYAQMYLSVQKHCS